MKKLLNIALLVSFLVTVLVPVTGVQIHKLASCLFLVLCLVHTAVYRRKLGLKRYLLLAIVVISFLSGLLGMILDQYPIIMVLHRVISLAVVFFMAIHIFVFHKRLK